MSLTGIMGLLAGRLAIVGLLDYLLPRLVLTLALLTLAEYVFPLDLGIDQLFFADISFSPFGTPPGLPSVLAYFGFMNLATALLLYRWARWVWPGQILALLTTVVAFRVFLGRMLGISQFYMFGGLSSVALHTALGVLLAAIGIA